jgi:histidyl-tRNA synthetase
MSQMQPVRGAHDLLPEDMRRYRHILAAAQSLAVRFGFGEIKTPIFEFSHVFSRTLGDASDIVTKETYTFTDKGGETLSLRPEGTASIIRAFISEGLQQQLPLKLFYEGPMFRYERPQKGRYRQFYQIGVELLGVESVEADVEVVSFAHHLLKALGVLDKTELQINSIGDKESRAQYREALVEYFKKHESSLSEESRKRLVVNPLRILDSKDKGDAAVTAQAPQLTDYLNADSKAKFDEIQQSLTNLGIVYRVNPLLVRGLDYYCHLVFEFRTSALGSQDAVLAGGRYDGLSEMMGGPATPSVGWASGVERLSLLMGEIAKANRPVTLVPLGDAAEKACRKLAHDLRGQGFAMDLAYGGNMSNRMKKAARQNARAAIIIGDNELAAKTFTFKDLDTGAQLAVREADLPAKLRELFG